ncbi:MAG: hypothetical protein HY258_07305 [Chloroflexi bacterium]|nr:hypothetical protein [Chloroflexota bacterium]
MKRILIALLVMVLVSLACGESGPVTPFLTPQNSVFDSDRTAYGFFPSPPEVSLDSVFKLYKDLGQHADFVLIQQNDPWQDFVNGVDGDSKTRTDLINQVKLARQNHLEYVFVVDALNGLNRRDFIGLPAGWEASFANPNVRASYKNYALWIVRQFHPCYLGLASEINTYMDAHPDDAPNFISLYNEIYAAVKAEAPTTQIFVTFQWEDLNNLFGQNEPGHQPGKINWDEVEAFEPNLDLWVISSYPFAAFKSGAEIPADYYSPLLTRTSKPLAVAEGGYTSRPVGPFSGTPEDQVAYLKAIHNQIGSRLTFWVYLLLNDFNLDSYAKVMKQQGQSNDVGTLGLFASVGLREFDGTPKPGMELWDSFRTNK